MNGLILRIERHGENAMHMFQVPSHVEISLLQRMVARTLNWDMGPQGQLIEYEIEAQQLGRRLGAGENLAQAGILDNFLLVFHNPNYDFSRTIESTTGLLNNPSAEVEAIIKQSAPAISQAEERKPQPAPPVQPAPFSSIAAEPQPQPALVQETENRQPEAAVNPILEKKPEAANPVQQVAANSNPVSGWRSLDIELPQASSESAAGNEEEPKKTGFVWKQLD